MKQNQEKKNEYLSLRLSKSTKQALKLKAQELGLDLTAFVEKIALENIVFLDANLKKAFSLFQIERRFKDDSR